MVLLLLLNDVHQFMQKYKKSLQTMPKEVLVKADVGRAGSSSGKGQSIRERNKREHNRRESCYGTMRSAMLRQFSNTIKKYKKKKNTVKQFLPADTNGRHRNTQEGEMPQGDTHARSFLPRLFLANQITLSIFF